MDEVQVVGLDLAKHVFQVHGLAANGRIVIRRQLRRGQLLAFFGKLPRCVVGMEASRLPKDDTLEARDDYGALVSRSWKRSQCGPWRA